MTSCRIVSVGAVLAVAAAIVLAGSGTATVQSQPAADLQALYARQVELGELALRGLEVDPERADLDDWAGALTRVRDCRVRLADDRARKIAACQWAVEQLEALASRTKAQVDAGRAVPWAMTLAELELNEAKITLLQLQLEERRSPG